MSKISIIDTKSGNIKSIANALNFLGYDFEITSDYKKLKEGSMWLYSVLNQSLNMTVLGPEEPAISKIRNEFIRTILIKIPSNVHLGNSKMKINKILMSFDAIAQYRSIRVNVNVDNY